MKGIAQPQSESPQNNDEGDPNIGASLREEAATEQEQAMYDALVEPMLGLIHGKETGRKVEQMLKNGTSIGQLAFQIAQTVIGQIEKNGKKVPLDILQLVAEDVIEDLVEIAVTVGLVEDNDKAIEQAYVEGLMEAVELYGNHLRSSGRMSPEENQAHLNEAMNIGGFDKNKVAAAVKQQMQGANHGNDTLPANQ